MTWGTAWRHKHWGFHWVVITNIGTPPCTVSHRVGKIMIDHCPVECDIYKAPSKRIDEFVANRWCTQHTDAHCLQGASISASWHAYCELIWLASVYIMVSFGVSHQTVGRGQSHMSGLKDRAHQWSGIVSQGSTGAVYVGLLGVSSSGGGHSSALILDVYITCPIQSPPQFYFSLSSSPS